MINKPCVAKNPYTYDLGLQAKISPGMQRLEFTVSPGKIVINLLTTEEESSSFHYEIVVPHHFRTQFAVADITAYPAPDIPAEVGAQDHHGDGETVTPPTEDAEFIVPIVPGSLNKEQDIATDTLKIIIELKKVLKENS